MLYVVRKLLKLWRNSKTKHVKCSAAKPNVFFLFSIYNLLFSPLRSNLKSTKPHVHMDRDSN